MNKVVADGCVGGRFSGGRTSSRSNIRAVQHILGCALVAVALCMVATVGLAQVRAFPDRSVRLVVPYPPSGAVDITARVLAKELGDVWGQPVVVDNRPGAAGVIAGDTVAKAPADGLTLLLTDDGVLSTVPFFQEKMPYDTLTDLVPIAMVGMFPYVLVTHVSLKVKSMAELIAAAQAKSGGMDYATNGVGGTHHLTWERLQQTARLKLNHVPYKGAAPALQDVLAGRVPMMLAAVATAFPYIKDGRLVPIATGGLTRAPLLPELPTLIESGFPGFEVISWMGVMAPKGTPPALIERISLDLNKVTQSESYRNTLAPRATEPRTSTPQAMGERIREEYERNQGLIKSLGLRPN